MRSLGDDAIALTSVGRDHGDIVARLPHTTAQTHKHTECIYKQQMGLEMVL